MDTSETHIKMCDCEEIQNQWHRRISEGDFTNKGVVSELDTYYDDNLWDLVVDDCVRKSTELIWLPRQDQLQEMMGEEYPINLLYAFHHFYNVNGGDLYPHTINGATTSMEQLWLAFAMKEKHNKVWTGEEWTILKG